MPPAYDLIIGRGGSIVVETVEAHDEDAAWRAGLMLHIDALMAVVCRRTTTSQCGLGFF